MRDLFEELSGVAALLVLFIAGISMLFAATKAVIMIFQLIFF